MWQLMFNVVTRCRFSSGSGLAKRQSQWQSQRRRHIKSNTVVVAHGMYRHIQVCGQTELFAAVRHTKPMTHKQENTWCVMEITVNTHEMDYGRKKKRKHLTKMSPLTCHVLHQKKPTGDRRVKGLLKTSSLTDLSFPTEDWMTMRAQSVSYYQQWGRPLTGFHFVIKLVTQ